MKSSGPGNRGAPESEAAEAGFWRGRCPIVFGPAPAAVVGFFLLEVFALSFLVVAESAGAEDRTGEWSRLREVTRASAASISCLFKDSLHAR